MKKFYYENLEPYSIHISVCVCHIQPRPQPPTPLKPVHPPAQPSEPPPPAAV